MSSEENLSTVNLLIDWIKHQLDSATGLINVGGIILAWLLTSSNRFIRDIATKALVMLYENNVAKLNLLLNEFWSCNDVYVIERILCACYGVVLRSNNLDGLKDLAENIFNKVFNQNEVFPHLLARDYARGIIEMACNKGYFKHQNVHLIYPAYNSTLNIDIPSLEHLKKTYKNTGYRSLWNSIFEDDFSHYVLGTNFDSFDWYDSKIDNAYKNKLISVAKNDPNYSPWDSKPEGNNFSLEFCQRWIFNRVVELGWVPDFFQENDEFLSRNNPGRSEHKAERIGKKYQWIAFFELLARISDNYAFHGNYIHNSNSGYRGPWQISRRDIDPTLIFFDNNFNNIKNTDIWWQSSGLKPKFEIKSDEAWLNSMNDLPVISDLIDIKHQNKNWLVLDGYFEWLDKEISTVNREKSYQIYYLINTYIIKNSDLNKFKEWIANQNLFQRWMPEGSDIYYMYLGEYPWAESYTNQEPISIINDGWVREGTELNYDKKVPADLLVTTNKYQWESNGYDCSISEHLTIKLPSKFIIDNMKLEWNQNLGEYTCQDKITRFIDPSLGVRKPHVLLADKTYLNDFLTSQNLSLVWTILGEKLIINSNLPRKIINGSYSLENGEVKKNSVSMINDAE